MELIQRRTVRASLTEWSKFWFRSRGLVYEPAAHHRLLISKLEAVERGDLDRFLCAMPFGSGKTVYCSQLFPAWYLANHPTETVLLISHTTERAEEISRAVRDSVLEHGKVLGVQVRDDMQAAGRWRLVSGGGCVAAGAQQAILGVRANLVVIDDAVKSREAASSESESNKLWNWFTSEVRSRLVPSGRIVCVNTRWSFHDLHQRLVDTEEKGGDRWDQLTLAAQAEEGDPLGRSVGEYLWSDDTRTPKYSEQLAREHKQQSPLDWASLYQGRPAPLAGDLFRAEWFPAYPQDRNGDDRMPRPDTLRVYAASDFATSSKATSDFTVHLVVGCDPKGKLWLLDCWRGRTSPDVWIERMLDLAVMWKPICWATEKGQIANSVGPFLNRRMRERKIPLFVEPFAPLVDKVIRCQSIRGKLALDGMRVPTKAVWYPAFMQEVLAFNHGRHDDQVDCLSLIGLMLETLMVGKMPERSPGKNWNPDHADRAWAPFKSDQQLEQFFRNAEAHEIGGGEPINWKTL
jgi:predicted phage terminase large subunit-like protein